MSTMSPNEFFKKILFIFVVSFILNLIWENLHVFLYSNYRGGQITEFILVRATLADAVIITIIVAPFLFIASIKDKSWLIVIAGIIISIIIEFYALNTGRWSYNEWMPIIPLIKTGLTPTIQLGLLGFVSYRLQKFFIDQSFTYFV